MIEVGQLVRRLCGGPVMLVVGVHQHAECESVDCEWPENGEWKRGNFRMDGMVLMTRFMYGPDEQELAHAIWPRIRVFWFSGGDCDHIAKSLDTALMLGQVIDRIVTTVDGILVVTDGCVLAPQNGPDNRAESEVGNDE